MLTQLHNVPFCSNLSLRVTAGFPKFTAQAHAEGLRIVEQLVGLEATRSSFTDSFSCQHMDPCNLSQRNRKKNNWHNACTGWQPVSQVVHLGFVPYVLHKRKMHTMLPNQT
eukprot:206205-Amphidinium_carterae.1